MSAAAETGPTPTCVPPKRTNNRHQRGEIWMVAADPQQPAVGAEMWSNRPALVVSTDVLNDSSDAAMVVYLSSSARKRTGPTHVQLAPASSNDGKATMALCEQVHTVDRSRLVRRLSKASRAEMEAIDDALTLSLSIRRDPQGHNLFRKWENYIKTHGIDMAAEIAALSGRTADQRVEALTRALELTSTKADAYRDLYEATKAESEVRRSVAEALKEAA